MEKEFLKNLPGQPGVYLMKDKSNRIIYVGKALRLKSRVSSYFTRPSPDPKTRVLVGKVKKIDLIVTANETEALILENNLIKKHQPRYNIILKDDKRYPFIRVSTATEPYPRILITRDRKNDGNMYFGPYTSVRSLRNIFRMISRLFPLKKCSKKLELKSRSGLFAKPCGKVCLNFQLKQCLAVCRGNIDPDAYRKMLGQVVLFLQGRNGELIRKLEQEMQQCSDRLDFERAGLVRDRIRAIRDIMEEQRIISSDFRTRDVLAVTEQGNIFNVTMLFIRDGKLLGKNNFFIRNSMDTREEVLNVFIKQYYLTMPFVPEEIIVPFAIEDEVVLEYYFRSRKEFRIRLPADAGEEKLLKMAEENGLAELQNYFMTRQYRDVKKQMAALKKDLHLKREPRVIEGFDISNISGTHSAGSMVRFREGRPDKNEYRRFRIRTVEGADDFRMMAEVVSRRYRRLKEEKKDLPDLVLIDGGKGQLHSALDSLKQLGLVNLPIISLAKKEEEIFLPGVSAPLRLGRSHQGLKLLQQVRDEAHRFGVNYHKKIRAMDFIPAPKGKKRGPS
ncbi:MAG: excinuclease ABC subunit UvrC [bacterium]|nr:excinuclease ABC subunit UvrC [bacterium]